MSLVNAGMIFGENSALVRIKNVEHLKLPNNDILWANFLIYHDG